MSKFVFGFFDTLEAKLRNNLIHQLANLLVAKVAYAAFVSHTHTDFCGTVNGTGQMFICVGIAKNMELWCDSRRVTGEKSQDLFNAVSIDTCRRHVRVLRIGAEWNRFLQHRVTMCLDYENRVQLT